MTFAKNLDTLITELGINANKLARALDFDPSYISRMRKGTRQPGNPEQFISGAAHYIAQHSAHLDAQLRLAALTGISNEDAAHEETREGAIKSYLGSDQPLEMTVNTNVEPLVKLLHTLDAFNLDEFLESIHFSDLKVPSLPFQFPTTKSYTGIEEMKQAELDFYKAAVLAKGTRQLIMFSDMPLEEMAQDKAFTKNVMMGIALLIRKGVHIMNIHDVHRPINEIIMGLEGWIPVYMTSSMESYYLPAPTNTAFLHFLRSCETVSCIGEAVVGDQGSGRYVLSKHASDVTYAHTRANQLLALAKPLLRVFRETERKKLEKITARIERNTQEQAARVGEDEFETISLSLLPGHYALIEKKSDPSVSILIEHPALVAALEQYEPTLF